MKYPEVWFWQRIISPHMVGLAEGLAKVGWPVVYVAQQTLSQDRVEQGWTIPETEKVNFRLAKSKREIRRLVDASPGNSIHICQGVRGNGLVGYAQRSIARRRLAHWVVLETVEDRGWKGLLRRLLYRCAFRRRRHSITGILAIGATTRRWIIERGVPDGIVYPFAYFLPNPPPSTGATKPAEKSRFRFLFVGQFNEGKRLDLLITALSEIDDADLELAVVGSGPLGDDHRAMAESSLPGRVDWIGRVPLTQVPQHMAQADCLVLPSRHDGWGAVAVEALMVGTPAIVSDACGVSGVVARLGEGGVFRAGNGQDLFNCLRERMSRGRIGPANRASLAKRAESLSGESGGRYLSQILTAARDDSHPRPPWEV